MSILVNPITEKFGGKIANFTLRTVIGAGKKFAKSIFGQSAGEKRIAEALSQDAAASMRIFGKKTTITPAQRAKARLTRPKTDFRGFPPTKIPPQPIKINPVSGKAEIVKSLTHEPPRHNAGFTGFHNKPAKPSIITPEYVAKAKSFKSQTPVQETRTQAYYDEIAKQLEQAKLNNGSVKYYNPKTGNTIELYGNSNVTVSKGNVDLVELDSAPQGFRRITRTEVDGKNYLHGRNSIEDVWDPRRGWTGESGHTFTGAPFFRNEPATRTPIIPS